MNKRLLTKKESENLKKDLETLELLKKKIENAKSIVLSRMLKQDLKKVEIDDILFTVKEAFERTDLDKKKLESDFPELVEKYSKTTHVNETLIVKI